MSSALLGDLQGRKGVFICSFPQQMFVEFLHMLVITPGCQLSSDEDK